MYEKLHYTSSIGAIDSGPSCRLRGYTEQTEFLLTTTCGNCVWTNRYFKHLIPVAIEIYGRQSRITERAKVLAAVYEVWRQAGQERLQKIEIIKLIREYQESEDELRRVPEASS